MSSLKQPLSSLAQESPDVATYNAPSKMFGGGSFVSYIIWFVIIAIVIWLILWATKPAFVQKLDVLGKPNGEIDQAKAIIAAIVISLIIVAIIWLIRSAANRS